MVLGYTCVGLEITFSNHTLPYQYVKYLKKFLFIQKTCSFEFKSLLGWDFFCVQFIWLIVKILTPYFVLENV